MPSSKRDSLKRKHTAISNALSRCEGWAIELHDLFLEYHPEYSDGYANILIMLKQTRVFIEKMRSHV